MSYENEKYFLHFILFELFSHYNRFFFLFSKTSMSVCVWIMTWEKYLRNPFFFLHKFLSEKFSLCISHKSYAIPLPQREMDLVAYEYCHSSYLNYITNRTHISCIYFNPITFQIFYDLSTKCSEIGYSTKHNIMASLPDNCYEHISSPYINITHTHSAIIIDIW